jgi:hypothetical protein
MDWIDYTGCGKLTSFFIWHFIFKKGSYLAAPYLGQGSCEHDNEPSVSVTNLQIIE